MTESCIDDVSYTKENFWSSFLMNGIFARVHNSRWIEVISEFESSNNGVNTEAVADLNFTIIPFYI